MLILYAAKSRGITLSHPEDKEQTKAKRQEPPQVVPRAVVTVYETVGGPAEAAPAATPVAQGGLDAYDKWLADAKQDVELNHTPQGMTSINDGR